MSGIPKCTSWIGHKFEGRFSYSEGSYEVKYGPVRGISAEGMVEILRSHQPKTYERDICIRCGVTVEKIKP